MCCTTVAKLALLGGPGVGKDTFIRIFQKLYSHISCRFIRLAEPLYEVQHFIYKMCLKEIETQIQDGILLNFLGKHMRAINPNVLLERFAKSVRETEPLVDMVICSDVRPIDAAFVGQMGFTIVHIAADPSIALERRKQRGDLTLGNSSHETETGIVAGMYDVQIANNDSLEEFEKSIDAFLQEFFYRSQWKNRFLAASPWQ